MFPKSAAILRRPEILFRKRALRADTCRHRRTHRWSTCIAFTFHNQIVTMGMKCFWSVMGANTRMVWSSPSPIPSAHSASAAER